MDIHVSVRPAHPDDAQDLLHLRNHYVAHGHATFDEQPWNAAGIDAWMASFAISGPHRLLVARAGAALAGFCSSQPYRAHPAFRRTVESSIYVAPGQVGRGVGSALYRALFSILEGEEIHRVLVGIALPNDGSLALHRRFGFEVVGTFDEYAVKNGRYISSTWLEKRMRPGELV